MPLTKRQKSNLGFTLLITVALGVTGFCIFLLLTGTLGKPAAGQHAAVRQTNPPGINAQRYEQVNTSHDGTFDHYCVNGDGMRIGPYISEFSVTPDDPLCK